MNYGYFLVILIETKKVKVQVAAGGVLLCTVYKNGEGLALLG